MKLEVTGLTKSYGKTRAADGLSLTIEAARVLVLIGPSGGGKSTLLRLLGGLETADAGVMEINGQPLLTDPAALQAYRRKNGFLFQQFNLFPHRSALGNVIEAPIHVLGMPLDLAYTNPNGRPTQMIEHGKPIAELI